MEHAEKKGREPKGENRCGEEDSSEGGRKVAKWGSFDGRPRDCAPIEPKP